MDLSVWVFRVYSCLKGPSTKSHTFLLRLWHYLSDSILSYQIHPSIDTFLDLIPPNFSNHISDSHRLGENKSPNFLVFLWLWGVFPFGFVPKRFIVLLCWVSTQHVVVSVSGSAPPQLPREPSLPLKGRLRTVVSSKSPLVKWVWLRRPGRLLFIETWVCFLVSHLAPSAPSHRDLSMVFTWKCWLVVCVYEIIHLEL